MPVETTLQEFARHGGLFGLVLGVLIVVQTTAVIYLWRRVGELQAQLMDIQNLRVAEAKDVRKELGAQNEETGRVLSELTTTIQLLKDATLHREKKR